MKDNDVAIQTASAVSRGVPLKPGAPSWSRCARAGGEGGVVRALDGRPNALKWVGRARLGGLVDARSNPFTVAIQNLSVMSFDHSHAPDLGMAPNHVRDLRDDEGRPGAGVVGWPVTSVLAFNIGTVAWRRCTRHAQTGGSGRTTRVCRATAGYHRRRDSNRAGAREAGRHWPRGAAA